MRLVIALALLAVPLVAAHHDTSAGRCDPQPVGAGIIHVPPFPWHSAQNGYYIDDRNFAMGNGVWIYQESNGVYAGGIEGMLHATLDLQRGGSSIVIPDDNEVCHEVGPWVPDTLIF